MLLQRLLLSISGYFLSVAALLSVIMVVPGLPDALGQDETRWDQRLRQVVAPLPELWRILLPLALMLTVLVAFSRLSLRGEVKVWRSVGTSAWPFARAVALVGLVLGALIVGPLWSLTKPDLDEPAHRSATTWKDQDDGSLWFTAASADLRLGAHLVLFEQSNLSTGVIRYGRISAVDGAQISLENGWWQHQPGDGGLDTQPVAEDGTPHSGAKVFIRLEDEATIAAFEGLAYRLSYPVLVVGLALIMLPLALSIDGQRWTVLKIVGGCLLALNLLFLLLMSDALARANFWESRVFFSGRAGLALCIGLLLILFTEERSA